MKINRKKFLKKAKINLEKYYRDQLGLRDWRERVEVRISEESGISLERVKKLERMLGSIKGRRIISIGSGWGGFVVAANKMGAKAFGIEPDIEKIEISKLRALAQDVENSFCVGEGEHLPFKDNTFDVVECFTVLEHVKKPEIVIDEMIRVLKLGGFCYIFVPNYLYPSEPHYKIYWVPMLPKPLAKLYLRLLKRNPEFIEHINYTTPHSISKLLSKLEHIGVMDPSTPPQINLTEAKTPMQKMKRIILKLVVKIYTSFGMNKNIEILIRKRKSAINSTEIKKDQKQSYDERAEIYDSTVTKLARERNLYH
jgi:ubiquinone/menaquinone biosynthesis C-methylase UbiE